jgi:hypothetical protein
VTPQGKKRKPADFMDRDEFHARLTELFPAGLSGLDDSGQGLLHCEVAAFRENIERACDTGRLGYAERGFRFIEECLERADADLENALEISFIEDFALGEQNAARLRVINERCSNSFRQKLADVHNYWSSR